MEFVSQYLVAAVCLLVGIFIWKKTCKQKGYPPGPTGIPIFGNILQVTRRPYIQFTKWAQEYGPIFSLKLAHLHVTVVSDPKIAKEIFNDPASTGRIHDNPVFKEFSKGNYGVINSQGTVWEQQRPFMLRTLKNFGFAKSKFVKNGMESLIVDECTALLGWFDKFHGASIPANQIFSAPVFNALWRIVSGERYVWEEEGARPKLVRFGEEYYNALQEVTGNHLDFAAWLIKLAPEYLGWNRYLKAVNNMNNLIAEVIKQHEQTFDGTNIRDYIDAQLCEIRKTADANSSFYKENGYNNMEAGIFDMILAGSVTTAQTLTWAFLYLSHHPQVQDKMYREIEDIMGTTFPALTNRVSMPYTEAVVMEVLRVSPVPATSMPHRMLEDRWYHGYFFPKGSDIYTNIFGVNFNPDIWGDPENFRPERFLSQDGNNVEKTEALLNFAIGKRQCIGETMVKDTLFLFLTSILQRFCILPGDLSRKADFESDLGIFYVAKPFKVRLVPRDQTSE